MPRTGNFGGYAFDEEVFAGMMQEADYWKNPIIVSGIIQEDPSIMNLIGEKGNVATIPIYKPLDANASGMEALNNDGETNNVPVEISGDKQTCMMIQRMKAFKAKDFTKELTGADPMTNIKGKIVGYYQQVWENELMNIAKACMGVTALKGHVLDLKEGAIEAGTIYDAEQAALGDMAGGLGLIVMHSMIYKEYQKMGMVDFDKYVINGVIQKEVTLPTIAGKHVLVTDRFTVTGASADTGGVFTLDGWSRGSKLPLAEINDKLKKAFEDLRAVQEGTAFFITYWNGLMIPTGEEDLFRITITLNTNEWKGA